MIPMVDLKAETKCLGPSITHRIQEVIDSGEFILGRNVSLLEKEISAYLQCRFSLGVANGTDALVLALKALDIGPGDEVITTPFTFFATGEAIALVGATPVFVDIEEKDFNINPFQIERAITKCTRAIIVVHLFGQAANMVEIKKLAQKYKLKIIEDACQAMGTQYGNAKVGSLSDVGCFSFFPSKNLGCYGDGGMIVCQDEVIYQKLCMLRNHGSKEKYNHKMVGYNSRLDEIQAAILRVKLKHLDQFLQKRREIAKRYTIQLQEFVKTPQIPNNNEHTFHQYCIEIRERHSLALYLQQQDISSAIYYPVPLHLQEAFQYLNYKNGDFPVAERVAKEILALPICPFLTVNSQQKIIQSIKNYYNRQD